MLVSIFRKPGMIPGFLLFTVCLWIAWKLATLQLISQNYQNVCHFVESKIFLSSNELKSWKFDCLKKARKLSPATELPIVIQTFNQSFSILKTSHLLMYAPDEAKSVWQGESKATGIESHYVGGELVISKIHKNSPADKAGLKFGDIVLEINGELANPEQAESEAGKYLIRTRGKQQELQLKPATFQRQEEVQIEALSPTTVLLRVPSFRAEFFEKVHWVQQLQQLKKYPRLIIDLRGNLGGNFVAGLRLLSPFLCRPTTVGSLIKPKWPATKPGILKDDLKDDSQIEIVDQFQQIQLSTFEGYGCLVNLKPGAISVLVDSASASTSEMVAQALKEFKAAKIFGSVSAGQLLVGMWYPMNEIGQGVKLSIPEAVYESHKGRPIEGPGVELDEVLFYHLQELENGEDSWIKNVSNRNISK
jgi:carboxyl-terminal processing protease